MVPPSLEILDMSVNKFTSGLPPAEFRRSSARELQGRCPGSRCVVGPAGGCSCGSLCGVLLCCAAASSVAAQ